MCKELVIKGHLLQQAFVAVVWLLEVINVQRIGDNWLDNEMSSICLATVVLYWSSLLIPLLLEFLISAQRSHSSHYHLRE
jgi:hypothetical protein